jgi:hypothetical protein
VLTDMWKKLTEPLARLFQWIADGQKKQPICKT